jgi:hypothetical protein
LRALTEFFAKLSTLEGLPLILNTISIIETLIDENPGDVEANLEAVQQLIAKFRQDEVSLRLFGLLTTLLKANPDFTERTVKFLFDLIGEVDLHNIFEPERSSLILKVVTLIAKLAQPNWSFIEHLFSLVASDFSNLFPINEAPDSKSWQRFSTSSILSFILKLLTVFATFPESHPAMVESGLVRLLVVLESLAATQEQVRPVLSLIPESFIGGVRDELAKEKQRWNCNVCGKDNESEVLGFGILEDYSAAFQCVHLSCQKALDPPPFKALFPLPRSKVPPDAYRSALVQFLGQFPRAADDFTSLVDFAHRVLVSQIQLIPFLVYAGFALMSEPLAQERVQSDVVLTLWTWNIEQWNANRDAIVEQKVKAMSQEGDLLAANRDEFIKLIVIAKAHSFIKQSQGGDVAGGEAKWIGDFKQTVVNNQQYIFERFDRLAKLLAEEFATMDLLGAFTLIGVKKDLPWVAALLPPQA